MKLRHQIESSEDRTHDHVKHLLTKYEKFRVSTMMISLSKFHSLFTLFLSYLLMKTAELCVNMHINMYDIIVI